ncbi:hypothetical protein SISSUDRAFT_1033864 [Sistotremastrum suecicum HHB10207 ss-3]|uniref:Uncharacterized protein n=1 Tax=Sistotremastrum suecicum HHB10207 ss-3 TaxID=1314776 RepID=A0A166CT14_9AGAM|nr:hypothetical protein SISSUDRAFT_1033864 [Sistotremastrum suecicum HHB10207 ss-3]
MSSRSDAVNDSTPVYTAEHLTFSIRAKVPKSVLRSAQSLQGHGYPSVGSSSGATVIDQTVHNKPASLARWHGHPGRNPRQESLLRSLLPTGKSSKSRRLKGQNRNHRSAPVWRLLLFRNWQLEIFKSGKQKASSSYPYSALECAPNISDSKTLAASPKLHRIIPQIFPSVYRILYAKRSRYRYQRSNTIQYHFTQDNRIDHVPLYYSIPAIVGSIFRFTDKRQSFDGFLVDHMRLSAPPCRLDTMLGRHHPSVGQDVLIVRRSQAITSGLGNSLQNLNRPSLPEKQYAFYQIFNIVDEEDLACYAHPKGPCQVPPSSPTHQHRMFRASMQLSKFEYIAFMLFASVITVTAAPLEKRDANAEPMPKPCDPEVAHPDTLFRGKYVEQKRAAGPPDELFGGLYEPNIEKSPLDDDCSAFYAPLVRPVFVLASSHTIIVLDYVCRSLIRKKSAVKLKTSGKLFVSAPLCEHRECKSLSFAPIHVHAKLLDIIESSPIHKND